MKSLDITKRVPTSRQLSLEKDIVMVQGLIRYCERSKNCLACQLNDKCNYHTWIDNNVREIERLKVL